ncbi:1-acyl-sn-glycerol-3-phosphate acyltransferase [Patescibacteria group bacterium]|nr:1-acyl-sn-glycerol-3-phosphate acyltransferase [Patescibacteria group bacterium]
MKLARVFAALLWTVLSSCFFFLSMLLWVVISVCSLLLFIAPNLHWRIFTGMQSLLAVVIFWGLRYIIGLVIRFETEGFNPSDITTVPVVVSNHVWLGDPVLIYLALRRVGWRLINWTMRRDMLWNPFGWAAAWTGSAFLDRKKGDPIRGERDLERIFQAGLRSLKRGLALVVLPEGTRPRDGSSSDSPYKHLGKFRPRGTVKAAEAMGKPAFIVICMHWSKTDQSAVLTGAKTSFVEDATALVNRSITIRVQSIPKADCQNVEARLEAIGYDMDRWLDNQEENL